jgi:cyclic beta-1,2-glucan synthetase
LPRDVAIAHPRAEEVKAAAPEADRETRTERRFSPSFLAAPVTHLMSNGRYAVMLTTAGAGYSRWRDIAVTRWREDPTCDDWGSFLYLKDVQSGEIWSAGAQPIGDTAEHGEVTFSEDHATFIRRDGTLTTCMEIIVSGEDDGEVRRISLTNSGRGPRAIELTSYSELVLTAPATDNAHPAFAKLFVETEYLAEYGALVAARRRRSPEEPEVWAAHFAVIDGKVLGDPEYESDRARFLGRGRTVVAPAAMMPGS